MIGFRALAVRAGMLLMAGAMGLAIGSPAEAAELEPVDLPAVLGELPLDDVPGTVVFLVDTSGSMSKGGLYRTVRGAVADFSRGLSEADRVSVVTFDATARQCAGGLAPGKDDARILGCLPRAADGGYTDFGRAFDAAIKVLSADSDRSGCWF